MIEGQWGIPGRASILVGGCWGSEGKGAAAAWLSKHIRATRGIAVTNAGAQAGHTTQFANGRKFICYHLPTTGVMLPSWQSYIDAGSIIDPDLLMRELEKCGVAESRVSIHPRAAVITDDHRATEKDAASSTAKIASTQKGVGAAIADKIMRRSTLARGCDKLAPFIHQMDLNAALTAREPRAVVIEVPQGTELSLNHGGEYPYTTSRDCYVNSGLADAGVHPSLVGSIAMVVRTHPIRVGNLYNEMGEEIGSSGPFYPDSIELSWDDFPGVEPERTTVTNRVRRISSWSDVQYHHACSLNRPNIVYLSFCDYFQRVEELSRLVDRMRRVEDELGLSVHRIFAFGPNLEDATDDPFAAAAWYAKRSFL